MRLTWNSCRRRFVLACTCLIVVISGTRVFAQGGTMTAVRVNATPGGGAQLILTFSSGGVPQFQLFGDDTPNVSVLLVGANRVQKNPAIIAPVGPIVSGQIVSLGDSLSVQLTLKAAAKVRVAPGSGQVLVIAIAPPTTVDQAAPTLPYPTPVSTALPMAGPGAVRAIIRLKYADLSEVVGLLVAGATIAPNDNFQPQPSAGNFGAPSSLGGGTVGGVPSFNTGANYSPSLAYGQTQNTTSISQRVNENVAIDRRLNAIVLTGPPDLVASYRAFIDEVDVPLGSVMLETQIVELTDTAARDLGIDYTNAGGQVAAGTLGTKSLSSAQAAGSLQAAVFATVQRGNGRIIAQPRIVALDNTSASIVTGSALPIVTSIAVSGVNAVQQQVQYVNVGVNLQIQPRISSDGYVTAHVFSEVSSVTGYSQTYPQISQRQAQTSAIVKDGDSFVIGGLLEKTEINSLSKIPGIGDLPLIGGLFRVRHNSLQTINLYIIVTPHIIPALGGNAAATPAPSPTLQPPPQGQRR